MEGEKEVEKRRRRGGNGGNGEGEGKGERGGKRISGELIALADDALNQKTFLMCDSLL